LNQWHTAVWCLRYETEIQFTYFSPCTPSIKVSMSWLHFCFPSPFFIFAVSSKSCKKERKGLKIWSSIIITLLCWLKNFVVFFCPEKEWKLGQHYLCFATIFLDSFIEIRSDEIIVRCNGSLPFEQVSLVKSFIGFSSITALSHSM